MNIVPEINIVFIQDHVTAKLVRIVTEDAGIIIIRYHFTKLVKQAVANKLKKSIE